MYENFLYLTMIFVQGGLPLGLGYGIDKSVHAGDTDLVARHVLRLELNECRDTIFLECTVHKHILFLILQVTYEELY